MKLIISILQDHDRDPVSKALNDKGYRVTVLPSTGAYFRRGNSTLLIGVQAEQVDQAVQTIKDNCAEPEEPGLRRATVFVINVDRFEQP